MSLSSQVITTYGESITVGGSSAKGFLSVINKSNSDPKTNMPVGVLQGERYRLITDALEPEVGDIIVYAGKNTRSCVLSRCAYSASFHTTSAF